MAGDAAGKWTDQDKLELIASILFANCPAPSMKGVQLPAGRTAKACTHVLHKFKSEFYKKPVGGEDGNESNGNVSAPSSPVKKTVALKAPRKRKAAGETKATKKAKVQPEEEEDDDILAEDCEQEA